MENLVLLLQSYSQDPDAMRWGLTATVAVGVFLFMVGISYLVLVAFNPRRARLRRIVGDSTRDTSTVQRLGERLQPLSPYILPKKEWERTKTDAQLVHAGLRSPQALTVFYAIKTLLGVGLALLAVTLGPMLGHVLDKQYSLMQIVIGALFVSFAGMTLPNMVLNRLVLRRQRAIKKAFPDALDMLVVAMEAGIGIAAAIERVSNELGQSHPHLADELSLVNAEIRAGVDRGAALRNLAQRTGVDDIKVFAGLIAQTLRFGTSIADTLRVFSEDFRDKRTQAAEEEAAKIGTKMIFPLVLCFFPSFFVVAVGPAVLKVMRAFTGLGGG
jgi:tight adherence protein C